MSDNDEMTRLLPISTEPVDLNAFADKPKWTQKFPEKDGYYWRTAIPTLPGHIVYCRRMRHSRPKGVVTFKWEWHGHGLVGDPLMAGQWWLPIDMPQPPEGERK